MLHVRRLIACCLALPLALAGCNDYPVHSLLDSFEVRVTSALSHDEPVKLDFLWVIDHSPSMCQEQVDLAKGFQSFVTELNSLGQIDAQMAVVTVQQVPDVGSEAIIRNVGQFMSTAAKVFPPNCIERVNLPCTLDAQCTKAYEYQFSSQSAASMCPAGGSAQYSNPYGGTDWRCKGTFDPKYTTNDNCSVNSYCWKHCKTDQECRDLFEPNVPKAEQRIKCYVPGGTSFEIAGCQYPPATEGCPPNDRIPCTKDAQCTNGLKCLESACRAVPCAKDSQCGSGLKCFDNECRKPCQGKEGEVVASNQCDNGFVCSRGYCTGLPPVLKQDQLDLFRCVATVGASQTQESKFEGGFRSAWYALDPNGPNCPKDPKGQPLASCQYKQLVRDDAYLVVVFVSDDDDCSVNLSIPIRYGTDQEKKDLKKILPMEVWEKCQEYGDAVAGNAHLNEGNCEYRKSKDPKIVCPSDCRKLAAGSQERVTCDAAAEASLTASKKVDFRFATVAEFVNKFRSLKSDPARVIVATITGDANLKMADPAQLEDQTRTDRVLYYKSKLRNIASGQAPYICAGKRGESGYGSRYVELTHAFRENGVVANICEGDSFGPALVNIANTILKRVVKVCLDLPPYWKGDEPVLKVVRTRGGQKTQLKFAATPEEADGDSFYLKASADCRQGKGTVVGQAETCKTTRDCGGGLVCDPEDGLCKVYNQAIYFYDVPEPGDAVEINYPADFGL